MRESHPPYARYKRHMSLPSIGEGGQELLSSSCVAVVGCGGLGSSIAEFLARSGIGRMIIIDRDVVEDHNLHRQLLYTEKDIGSRKVAAARKRIAEINSNVSVDVFDDRLSHTNIHLLRKADIIMDGTDNLYTRFLINDYSVKEEIPWIYGGALATSGMTASFVPGGACLRCLFPDIPAPGSFATCQSAGVIGTLPTLVAALQSTEAIKMLVGREPRKTLLQIDIWGGKWQEIVLEKQDECPCCSEGKYPFLEALERNLVTATCEGDTVNIVPIRRSTGLARKLKERYPKGTLERNMFILFIDGAEMVVWDDGKAVITGMDQKDALEAYSKYVGI